MSEEIGDTATDRGADKKCKGRSAENEALSGVVRANSSVRRGAATPIDWLSKPSKSAAAAQSHNVDERVRIADLLKGPPRGATAGRPSRTRRRSPRSGKRQRGILRHPRAHLHSPCPSSRVFVRPHQAAQAVAIVHVQYGIVDARDRPRAFPYASRGRRRYRDVLTRYPTRNVGARASHLGMHFDVLNQAFALLCGLCFRQNNSIPRSRWIANVQTVSHHKPNRSPYRERRLILGCAVRPTGRVTELLGR